MGVGREAVTVRISPAAARRITEMTRDYRVKVGEQFVPVITWVIDDTHNKRRTPYLGLGLIDEKEVRADRWVRCDEFECKIAQHLPDDILARFPSQFVDFVGEELKFVEP
jgi:hypothetical protein